MEELAKAYDPKGEDEIYRRWELSGFFNPDTRIDADNTRKNAETFPRSSASSPRKSADGKVFSIILPPPNVTGSLHMGHAAMLAIEDILVRYHRMRGDRTLWVPGTDHAAIATQEKVERELYKKEGKTRHDLGRDEFLRRVQTFAKESHDTIIRQIKKMGASLDWSREAFTLDEPRSLAVRTAFKRMYDAGLIYRGERIVNWDPKMQTTVSDDEIEWKEEKSAFYYLKYGPFVIGTARPETKFGDKYVVMHPTDKRYAKYKHGETLEVEWINGPITATIIKDKAADPKFGTGVMTITPWHDATDFDIAERHKLEKEQIIDLRGKLLPVAGEFAGKKILEARKLIVEKLKSKGLLEKVDERYVHRIATNSRGGGIIEPQILEQWFVNVNKEFTLPHSKIKGIASGSKTTLKKIMIAAVKSGQIKIIPERFKKIYFHWIENLRDWCISRQIWYGHRIPVWYCGGMQKSEQPKMGFHEDVVPQVLDGKTKTYRLRDYGFNVGDRVLFENSQTKTLFGYGILRQIQETTVNKIDYRDKTHYKTYKNLRELIAAFKLRNPDKAVTPTSKAYLYAYEFHRFTKQDAEHGCGQVVVTVEEPRQCPACGGTRLEQDPDTLDTWFSSGLWTFSTLGWPSFAPSFAKATEGKKASDGKPSIPKKNQTFHPTSVLETGYDILFFWVARMVLMSGFLLGDVPFKTVYLHGLVRDAQGRKMSKSLGNVIDPLTMSEKYGADATRLSLIMGTAPGNDTKLSEDKVRGFRNFSTKIWNIGRFLLMQEARGLTRTGTRLPAGRQGLAQKRAKINFTAGDKKNLKEMEALKKKVEKNIEAFKFHDAAYDLYHYLWHTFADKIIEEAKPRLQGTDAADRAAALTMLTEIFTSCLKILHPFMPFVTEAVYEQFYPDKMLIVEPW